MKLFLTVSLPLLLSGCAFIPQPEKRAQEKEFTVDEYSRTGSVALDEQWWKTFESEELTSLISQALTDSLTLKETWFRLKQAEAAALKSGAALLPTVDGKVDASTRRDYPEERSSFTTDSYSAGLAASYEVDLWGRISSERDAAQFDLHASKSDFETAAISLSSSIATAWIDLVGQKAKLAILKEQEKLNETYLDLIKTRTRNGLANVLDVYQQQQALDRTRADIPLTNSRIRLSEHTIAVLLGKSPLEKLGLSISAVPELSALPALGVSTDLLDKRPDIQKAWNRLRASDYRVAVAEADRLPALRLSAAASYKASELSDVFDNWYSNLAAGITAPLFDGGRREQEVNRRRAIVQENLMSYQKAVLGALKDVEDALVKEHFQKEHLVVVNNQFEHNKRTLNEAKNRYVNGLNDYLPVLTALLTVQNTEISLINKQVELLKYRVELHKSLGGTWTKELSFSDEEESK